MSTTRKIEGWWLRMGDIEMFWEDEIPAPNKDDRRATLLIHAGEQRPVYTQEEHEAEFQRRAAAMAMSAISMIRSAAKTGIHVGQACGYIGKACLDAGIVLDPNDGIQLP